MVREISPVIENTPESVLMKSHACEGLERSFSGPTILTTQQRFLCLIKQYALSASLLERLNQKYVREGISLPQFHSF